MAEPEVLTRLRESTWSSVPGLTHLQARALEALGEELSATDEDSGERTSLIQVRFTSSGLGQVRVAEAIGLVGVGPKSWTVDPKIPADHLFYLLQRAQVLPATSTQSAELASGKHLWHLLYDWFLTSCEAVVRADLAKGYTRTKSELPFVRGSLDAVSMTRSFLRGRPQAVCTFEDFTADIALNRMLKSALLHGIRTGALGKDAARRTRRLLARFSEVSTASAQDFRVTLDRPTRRYRDALPLARHILEGKLRELQVGDARAWCFLWRTPEAVEAGIRNVLADGLKDVVAVARTSRTFSPLQFTPDLTFKGFGVGDVKYSLDKGSWRRADVYQLLAFATAHECSNALLVNFDPKKPPSAKVDVAGTVLDRVSWQLSETPAGAAERLVEDVRLWVSSTGTTGLLSAS